MRHKHCFSKEDGQYQEGEARSRPLRLMSQLQGFQRLALVLSVAPLGLIGVVAALLLSGRPLGFVAILGILALFGMITKNAVILIGQIEAERAQRKTVWQAAIDASSSRFRPIMLTAISTSLPAAGVAKATAHIARP